MKHKMQFIAMTLTLALIAVASVTSVVAQHSHDHGDKPQWKKGMVRLNRSAYAGNVRLSSGMYHVKHLVEGDKHWLVFKEVTLRAGYQEGFMWEGKEVARVECRVEAAEKSLRNTKVVLTKSDSRTPSIQEVQIAGEKVRHILLSGGPAV